MEVFLQDLKFFFKIWKFLHKILKVFPQEILSQLARMKSFARGHRLQENRSCENAEDHVSPDLFACEIVFVRGGGV